jgi:transcriptional regulator with XRE-family HTH domain
MTPAEVLIAARRRRGLTQAQLAARAGTRQPVVSIYERGHRDPTTSTLRRLVAAAGEVLELGLAQRPPDIPPPQSVEQHAERLVDLLHLVDALPARRRPRPPEWPRMVSR